MGKSERRRGADAGSGGSPKERLLDAAAELLATRPPSAISTREIAQRAGVQQSLIFRHFGTKADLVREVAVRYAGAYLQTVGEAGDALEGFHRAFDYLLDEGRASLIALAFLPGEGEARWPAARPGIDEHVRQLGRGGPGGGRNPYLLTSVAIAFMAGWSFLEEWALANDRLADVSVTQARAEVHEMLERFVRTESSLPWDARA
jgi:AcrR family transcriptional regulator